jgi:capsid protein
VGAWALELGRLRLIDPVKDATANDIRLANGTANLAGVLGEIGEDWRDFIDQLAREIDYCRRQGRHAPAAGRHRREQEGPAAGAGHVRPTPGGTPDVTPPGTNGHGRMAAYLDGGDE